MVVYRDDVGFQTQTFVDQSGKPVSAIVCGKITNVDASSMHFTVCGTRLPVADKFEQLGAWDERTSVNER